jgi:hypothetical protein
VGMMEWMVVCVFWLLLVLVVTKKNNQQHLNILHSQCYLIASFLSDCGGCDVGVFDCLWQCRRFKGGCCILDGIGCHVKRFYHQNCNL